ncbi:MAG: nuclear transport factor 2 family protein [Gluconacetobacter diazotrophicus]|nr:nuclear transport factor 2 family protein [Gluconacetobacter diazotrophicus]
MPALLLAALALAAAVPVRAEPIPAGFDAAGADRQAIEDLLRTYAAAVSSKNQALFETLLLNKDIPFSGTWAVRGGGGTANYESFRRGVFEGSPFTQSFRDVRISRDGPLADVSLVFVNRGPGGDGWGWKTMLLLKVDGRWKIASEFYTGHELPKGS